MTNKNEEESLPEKVWDDVAKNKENVKFIVLTSCIGVIILLGAIAISIGKDSMSQIINSIFK